MKKSLKKPIYLEKDQATTTIIEEEPTRIYEDKIRAKFITFIHEFAYRTKYFRDSMDSIYSCKELFLSKLCDNIGLSENVI